MSEVPEVQAADVPAGAFLLDVREPVEWAAGHADGAVHIPMNQVPARLAELPDAEIVVVCKTGARSAAVAEYLNARGHHAVNLAGGTYAWQAAGRPMVAESGREPFVL